MDKNQLSGSWKVAKGSAREGLGKITGNRTEEAKGKVEKTIGHVQEKL